MSTPKQTMPPKIESPCALRLIQSVETYIKQLEDEVWSERNRAAKAVSSNRYDLATASAITADVKESAAMTLRFVLRENPLNSVLSEPPS